jgi:hypothetical protein
MAWYKRVTLPIAEQFQQFTPPHSFHSARASHPVKPAARGRCYPPYGPASAPEARFVKERASFAPDTDAQPWFQSPRPPRNTRPATELCVVKGWQSARLAGGLTA